MFYERFYRPQQEYTLEDVNPPKSLAELAESELKPDVAKALNVAIRVFGEAGFPPQSVLGYYLENEGCITGLEVRNLSMNLAKQIKEGLSKEKLGIFMSWHEDQVNVGLPYGVHEYKIVPRTKE